MLRIFPGLPTGTLYHQIGNGMCWKIIMGIRKAEFSGSFGDLEHPRAWNHQPQTVIPGDPKLAEVSAEVWPS